MPKKVTLISRGDINKFHKTYYIKESLRSISKELSIISPLSQKYKYMFGGFQKLYNSFSSKEYRRHREPLILRGYFQQIKKRLEELSTDILFIPSSLLAAYLEAEEPVVFWTDATFAGMIDFYPSYSNMSTRAMKNGNEAEQRALKNANLALYRSDWAAQTALDNYDVDESKVKVVPFGASLEVDYNEDEIEESLLQEANKIAQEDIKTNKRLGRFGNQLIEKGDNILTHCNAGALATVGYGTALGVIRAAHAEGKNIKVYMDETRPRLQGASLTAFEMLEEDIPATLIVDSTAATLMKKGVIDKVVVGADRIAKNGDTANKIGTFMLSVLAKEYDVPFYIAAPLSTVDFEIDSGDDIEIEIRADKEVTDIRSVRIAPVGVDVYNPAFDVTPAENITAIITEKGVIEPPFIENLNKARK